MLIILSTVEGGGGGGGWMLITPKLNCLQMQQIVQTSKCWHIVVTDSFVMLDSETYKLDILI